METDSKRIRLIICPECKGVTLMLNETTNRYECLHCRESFNKILVDRDNQLVEAERKTLDDLSAKDTTAWVGNNRWNPKKKRWERGVCPERMRHFDWAWILVPLVFILLSVLVTWVLNCFHLGVKFWIFGW